MNETQENILKQFETIKTKRCVLRKITLDDAQDMYRYCSNPEVTQYTKFNTHKSIEDTQNAIEQIFIPEKLTKWGITLKESDKVIGTIDYLSLDDHSATLAYALSQDYWGQGIVPEAAKELVKIAFEELSLKVVYASHHIKNEKSGNVMKKIGMTKWGKDYYFDFKRQPYVENVKYGMTVGEYKKLKEEILDL